MVLAPLCTRKLLIVSQGGAARCSPRCAASTSFRSAPTTSSNDTWDTVVHRGHDDIAYSARVDSGKLPLLRVVTHPVHSLRFLQFVSDAQCPPFAARMAAHTRSGVAGMSICRMPYADSASTIAFMIEEIDPAQPASPQPFTPSG